MSQKRQGLFSRAVFSLALGVTLATPAAAALNAVVNANVQPALAAEGTQKTIRTIIFEVKNSNQGSFTKTITVADGTSLTSYIPKNLKPAAGYEGGSWSVDPVGKTATADTTYTWSATPKKMTVTLKVANGTWADGTTTPKTVQVSYGEKISQSAVPTGMKPASGYEGGRWDTTPTLNTIKSNKSFTYVFTRKATPATQHTITFVINNSTKGSRYVVKKAMAEGATISAQDVPSGFTAREGYEGGAWDSNPVGKKVSANATYTFSYNKKNYMVTFKVVNGTWADGTTAAKTLQVPYGTKIAAKSVPTGMKPASGYEKGSWNQTPTLNAITGAKTFTYTFTKKAVAQTSYIIRFVVNNSTKGSFTQTAIVPRGMSIDRFIPTGLTAAAGYEGGSWNVNPQDKTATANTTYTWTATPKKMTVTFKVQNGTWADGTTTAKTLQVNYGERIAFSSVPTGMKANSGYQAGRWSETPTLNRITSAKTFTYSFAKKNAYHKVTFVIKNSTLGTTYTKTVSVLDGNNIAAKDIPSRLVPKAGYTTGSWDSDPAKAGAITKDTTFTYTFVKKAEAQAEIVPMYRLYNRVNKEHFYTASINERDTLVKKHGWIYEGIGWYAPKKSSKPVYRLYNPILRDHHYTMSINERDTLVKKHGWRYEGIGWYSDDAERVPVYRQFNRALKSGSHNYTTDANERKVLTTQRGWIDEGVGWYAVKDKNGK